MDPFSITGIVIIAFIAMFLGRILSYVSKFVYYGLIVVFVLIFIFGISLDEVLNILGAVLLWAF